MKITPINTDIDFQNALLKRIDGQGKEVCFIDWIPTSKVNKLAVDQVDTLKRCISENIPVIIFDRYCAMSSEEVLYILKNAQSLLIEPSVIPRPGFMFMPYWVMFNEHKTGEIGNTRRFQTGFKGTSFNKDLELNVISLVKDKIVVGLDTKVPEDKVDILKSIVCIGQFEFTDFETMILTDSAERYQSGTLPDITYLVRDGVVPLLWHKHKWLHSIFRHFVVYDSNDIRWVTKMYKTCSYGFMEDVKKNVLDYLPEMEMNNFIDSIIEKVEKL